MWNTDIVKAKGERAFLSVCGAYAVLTWNTCTWIHILHTQTYTEREARHGFSVCTELMYCHSREYVLSVHRVDTKR